MPNTPVLKSEQLPVYLSGYADGEGSFCVSFSPRSKLKSKIEIRPSFSISQNFYRSEVLDLYLKYFDCGSIRPDRSDKTFKYEVRKLKDLNKKIIPHFKKYPLLSSKMKDFNFFSEICELMRNKTENFEKIIIKAFKMNISGKRKYNKEFLLSLL